MLKKSLKLILLVTISINQLKSTATDLIELNAALNQLENIKAKFITKPKILPRYAIPSDKFYEELQDAIKNAIKGNSKFLTDLKTPSAEVAKYMISISLDHEPSQADWISSNLLLLVQLFDRIQAKYEITDKIIITSVASGDLAKEKILLKTLHHFGYKLIKFYAIDPDKNTLKIMKKFKEDPQLTMYEYQHFNDSKDYIKEIIDGQHEKPDACLTFFPDLIFVKQQDSYNPNMHNICTDRAKERKLTTLLIAPHYFNELDIATSDQHIIENINEMLAKHSHVKFNELQEQVTTFLHRPYRCEQNVALNFLEIIKLASSRNNDCIAYYKSGNDINTYHNIASKSIAQLYLETGSISSFYSKLNIDIKQFKLWSYNPQINQFEQIKLQL